MTKRILRLAIKIVAVAAALVFIFDKKDSGSAGIMGSVAVLFICFLIWQIFDLGAEDRLRRDNPEE
jgi:hypothetical protein